MSNFVDSFFHDSVYDSVSSFVLNSVDNSLSTHINIFVRCSVAISFQRVVFPSHPINGHILFSVHHSVTKPTTSVVRSLTNV